MKKKTLLISALFFATTGAIALGGYMIWNKPHRDVTQMKATSLGVESLYTAFSENEQQANAAYLNKTIQVSGIITEHSVNQDGNPVAILGTSDPLGGIQCTFRDNNMNLKNGEQITVKGFCNGYTMVVILNDCVIL